MLTKNQRARRDNAAARAAVHMANEGKRPAIAVDDDLKSEHMIKRVLKAARAHGFKVGDSKRTSGVIEVPVGAGHVVIISADHL